MSQRRAQRRTVGVRWWRGGSRSVRLGDRRPVVGGHWSHRTVVGSVDVELTSLVPRLLTYAVLTVLKHRWRRGNARQRALLLPLQRCLSVRLLADWPASVERSNPVTLLWDRFVDRFTATTHDDDLGPRKRGVRWSRTSWETSSCTLDARS